MDALIGASPGERLDSGAPVGSVEGSKRSPFLGLGPGRATGYAAIAALSVALAFGIHAAGPGPVPPADAASASTMAAVTSAGPTATPGSGSPSVTTAPTATPTATPTTTPTATPTAGPTAVPLPSQASPTAAITFTSVMLDSTTDKAAMARTFTFDSDGPGVVSAEIVTTSPTETTKVCISADGATPDCASGGTPGFFRPTTTVHSHWTVTLASANEGTPTVDVAFRWPAVHPSIHLDGGRFQGSPNPDSLRSLNATFETRAGGMVSLEAAWPPATTPASLILSDASGRQPVEVGTVAPPAASSLPAAYTHSVAAGRTYTLTLFNTGTNAGRPNLAATITFP